MIRSVHNLNTVKSAMDMICESTLRASSFKNRVISRDCTERVQMPGHSESLFALFFGPAVFSNAKLVTAVNTAINALPPAQQNLDAFLDLYNLVLDKRRDRVFKSRHEPLRKPAIFCSGSGSGTTAIITYTDVNKAAEECKHAP